MIVDTLPDQPATPLPGVVYWASTSRYGDVRVMFLSDDGSHYTARVMSARPEVVVQLRRLETTLYLQRP